MTAYNDILLFLYQEASSLDDKRWDDWLKFYDEKAVFWMPAWDDEDELTTDPQKEISLIYYPNRMVWKTAFSGLKQSVQAPVCPSRALST